MWVLTIHQNDPDYLYSKNVIYAEKDRGTFEAYAGEYFDQRGRFYGGFSFWLEAIYYPDDELYSVQECTWFNALTGHHTYMHIGTPTFDVPDKLFAIKNLIKTAR